MSYVSDWKEWEEAAENARAANPLCDESATCPAPDDGHLVGCRANRARLAALYPGFIPSGFKDQDD